MLIYGLASVNPACPTAKGYNGITIRNSVFARATKQGIVIRPSESAAIVRNVRVYNNTVYGVPSVGVDLQVNPNLDLVNNLTFGNNSGGPQVAVSAQGTVLISHNGYGGSFGGACTSCVAGVSTADVLDVGAGDFRLSPGSRAIDMGVTLTTFSTDATGKLRPAGAWDIGAFER